MTTRKPTRVFRGLNNVGDPLRLGVEWFTTADNVVVTQQHALNRAEGFRKVKPGIAITGAYATEDQSRLYVIDDGELRQMARDMSYTVLRTGLSATAKVSFEEVNGVVFFANGVDFGTIEAMDGARPWGINAPDAPTVEIDAAGTLPEGTYQILCTFTDSRGMESSNSEVVAITLTAPGRLHISGVPQVARLSTNVYVTQPDGIGYFLLASGAGEQLYYDAGMALGRELPFFNLSPPRGSIPAFFGGRMYLAEYFPEADQSAVWSSLPLHFHHFDVGSEGLLVPGRVRVLKGVADALIIGTDRQIWSYDGDRLTQLAAYGVAPGNHAAKSRGTLYFWSLRGLCKALPFANITESTVSVPPGLSAGATVVEKDGTRRYVVALKKGGTAFNRRIT